jgi:hypothetical protein
LDVLIPRVLTLSATRSTASTLQLTCRTINGTVAAVLEWREDDHPTKLPEAIVKAIRTSGRANLKEPVASWNLALLKPGIEGQRLNVSWGAPDLVRQLEIIEALGVALGGLHSAWLPTVFPH